MFWGIIGVMLGGQKRRLGRFLFGSPHRLSQQYSTLAIIAVIVNRCLSIVGLALACGAAAAQAWAEREGDRIVAPSAVRICLPIATGANACGWLLWVRGCPAFGAHERMGSPTGAVSAYPRGDSSRLSYFTIDKINPFCKYAATRPTVRSRCGLVEDDKIKPFLTTINIWHNLGLRTAGRTSYKGIGSPIKICPQI